MNKLESQFKWIAEVEKHHEAAEKFCEAEGREAMMTVLYGSQNYGLATETSDVDTKTFVFPSLHETALHLPMLSCEKSAPDGAHIEMKDYRDMCVNIKKQSINFLECLFSPYVIVPQKWYDFYVAMHSNRELFARMDVNHGMKSMLGHMNNMKKRYDRDGNVKQAATLMRLADFVKRYRTDEPYENILFYPNNIDMLREMRSSEKLSRTVECMVELALKTTTRYVDEMPVIPQNEHAVKLFEEIQKDTFVRGFEMYGRENYGHRSPSEVY